MGKKDKMYENLGKYDCIGDLVGNAPEWESRRVHLLTLPHCCYGMALSMFQLEGNVAPCGVAAVLWIQPLGGHVDCCYALWSAFHVG